MRHVATGPRIVREFIILVRRGCGRRLLSQKRSRIASENTRQNWITRLDHRTDLAFSGHLDSYVTSAHVLPMSTSSLCSLY